MQVGNFELEIVGSTEACIMKKKKHQPPSKIKYNTTHPTVSVRVSQDLYDQLKELREKSGKSLGDILREALKKQAPSVNQAFTNGYSKGAETYRVTYACSICGKPIVVTTPQERADVASYMKQNGWGHKSCLGI